MNLCLSAFFLFETSEVLTDKNSVEPFTQTVTHFFWWSDCEYFHLDPFQVWLLSDASSMHRRAEHCVVQSVLWKALSISGAGIGAGKGWGVVAVWRMGARRAAPTKVDGHLHNQAEVHRFMEVQRY